MNTGIIKRLSYLKIYLGFGQEYISNLKYPVTLAIFLKVYLPTWSNLRLVSVALVAMVLMAILGFIDAHYIKLQPTTEEIKTREFNGYFGKLEKSVVPKSQKI